jgi:hypothetical protein
MDKQPIRHRRASRAAAQTLVLAAVMAALVAILGAGQALGAWCFSRACVFAG